MSKHSVADFFNRHPKIRFALVLDGALAVAVAALWATQPAPPPAPVHVPAHQMPTAFVPTATPLPTYSPVTTIYVEVTAVPAPAPPPVVVYYQAPPAPPAELAPVPSDLVPMGQPHDVSKAAPEKGN